MKVFASRVLEENFTSLYIIYKISDSLHVPTFLNSRQAVVGCFCSQLLPTFQFALDNFSEDPIIVAFPSSFVLLAVKTGFTKPPFMFFKMQGCSGT